MRLLAFAMVLVLLVPAASAGPPAKASFELAATQTRTLTLHLDATADVRLSVQYQLGYSRDLVLDGPGTCDLRISAGGGPAATVGTVACKRLAAGDHTFRLTMEVGYAKGWLVTSKGNWA